MVLISLIFCYFVCVGVVIFFKILIFLLVNIGVLVDLSKSRVLR